MQHYPHQGSVVPDWFKWHSLFGNNLDLYSITSFQHQLHYWISNWPSASDHTITSQLTVFSEHLRTDAPNSWESINLNLSWKQPFSLNLSMCWSSKYAIGILHYPILIWFNWLLVKEFWSSWKSSYLPISAQWPRHSAVFPMMVSSAECRSCTKKSKAKIEELKTFLAHPCQFTLSIKNGPPD